MKFPKSNDYKFENPIVGLKKLSGDSKGAIKFMRKDLTLSGTFYHNQHNQPQGCQWITYTPFINKRITKV